MKQSNWHEELRNELLEKFAALEHERWGRWQSYLHSKLFTLTEYSKNPHLKVMPTELISHWEKQIKTPYSNLSEHEKEMDRKEVMPYLDTFIPLLDAYADQKVLEREEKLAYMYERQLEEVLTKLLIKSQQTDDVRQIRHEIKEVILSGSLIRSKLSKKKDL